MQLLMIDGHGDPNTSKAYADAIATIYPVAYTLRFFSKNDLDRDYVVMPVEALWWSEDMNAFTTARDKSRWDWTLLTLIPDWITREHIDTACQSVVRKVDAPPFKLVASSRWTRVCVCRPCSSAPSTTRRLCWARCTTSSSPRSRCR